MPGSLPSIPAQMREMAKLVRAGKVRARRRLQLLGHADGEAAAALRRRRTHPRQQPGAINLLDRRVESNGVLAAARGLGVTLIAYSPLAQGILTGRFHDDPALVRALPWGRRSRLGPASRFLTPEGLARTAPLIAELRAVGEAHGASVAQVALAWLVTHYGDTVVAIPGASRPEQAAATAAAMDLRLTEAEMAEHRQRSRRRSRSARCVAAAGAGA